MPPTLLDAIRDRLTVDVDSMDPDVAARHSQAGLIFRDMTSNQAIVYSEAVKVERIAILRQACDGAKATGLELDVEHQNVLLALEVYPYITGRLLVQTSPSKAYDTEGTIAHAKRLVALFESKGVPKFVRNVVIDTLVTDRLMIPATPESILACQYLEKIGIRTLATCLFNLPQALAASQAKCTYVAPYFNELRVHFEPGIWKAYENTAKDHPAGPVIKSIVEAFKARSSQTLVIALASLSPDHLTLSGSVLDQLAAAPATEIKVLPIKTTEEVPDNDPDYLTNGAAAFKEALAADEEASRKLADALKIFGEMEQRTRDLIKVELGSV
ncbi:hypothetical protein EIP86_002879 [Pleurotus ostreatoroseus]|nr:hypothetical protein EIP86_002879 [Pleurotus ostreatoroseus]